MDDGSNEQAPQPAPDPNKPGYVLPETDKHIADEKGDAVGALFGMVDGQVVDAVVEEQAETARAAHEGLGDAESKSNPIEPDVPVVRRGWKLSTIEPMFKKAFPDTYQAMMTGLESAIRLLEVDFTQKGDSDGLVTRKSKATAKANASAEPTSLDRIAAGLTVSKVLERFRRRNGQRRSGSEDRSPIKVSPSGVDLVLALGYLEALSSNMQLSSDRNHESAVEQFLLATQSDEPPIGLNDLGLPLAVARWLQ